MTAWGLALALTGLEGAPPDVPPPSADAVEVTWQAPPGCPDRADVAEGIARLVGTPAGAPAQVGGVVRQTGPSAFVLDLAITVAQGALRRRVQGTSCLQIADAAVAIAASVIDPDAAAARMQASATDPLGVVGNAHGATWPVRRPITGFVRVSGAGSLGVLPRWGGGPNLAGGIDVARARVELRTFFDAPQRTVVSGTGVTATFVSWSAAALGCFVPGRGTLTVPLCGGPEVGWIRGRAEGLQRPQTARRVLVDVMGSAALAYTPVVWLALRAEVTGVVVLTPGRFVIEDLGGVHRIGAGGVRLGVGVEFRFPVRHSEGAR